MREKAKEAAGLFQQSNSCVEGRNAWLRMKHEGCHGLKGLVHSPVIFKDARWGQNYAPYDRSFVLDEAMLFKIRDALQKQL